MQEYKDADWDIMNVREFVMAYKMLFLSSQTFYSLEWLQCKPG